MIENKILDYSEDNFYRADLLYLLHIWGRILKILCEDTPFKPETVEHTSHEDWATDSFNWCRSIIDSYNILKVD